MKKNYQKPTLQVVQLQQQTQLLAGTNDNVIGPGQPNLPAAARGYRGQWDDDWSE